MNTRHYGGSLNNFTLDGLEKNYILESLLERQKFYYEKLYQFLEVYTNLDDPKAYSDIHQCVEDIAIFEILIRKVESTFFNNDE